MNKKGFTLVEIIVALAILGGISLIAVPSISGIQNRSQLKSDKLIGAQIGQAVVMKTVKTGDSGLTLNEQVKYNEIENIGEYISEDHEPETMKDGYYVVSQVKIGNEKIILVGITKNGEIIEIGDLYEDGKKPGWVWCQAGDIGDLVGKIDLSEDEEDILYTITASSNALGGITPAGEIPVLEGNDATFFSTETIDTTDIIYTFSHWLKDEERIDDLSEVSFSNVQEDHTIQAVYSETAKSKLTVGLEGLMQIETNVAPNENIVIESTTETYNTTGISEQSGTSINFTMPENDVEVMGIVGEESSEEISEYTITYNANGGTGTMASQTETAGNSVTLTTNAYTRSGYTFVGWSTSSTATSATYTNGQTITPTSSMTLYAVWEKEQTLLSSVVNVGDYITYIPSSTSYTVPTTISGYTSDQTYNPASVTIWRVFSNDKTNVEIISQNSVGDLSLNTKVAFINYVQTLQDMAAAFINPSYAVSARSFGYNEDGITDVSNYRVIDTAKYPLVYGKSGFPYDVYNADADCEVTNNNTSLVTGTKSMWVASRAYTLDEEDYENKLYVGKLNTSGNMNIDWFGMIKLSGSEVANETPPTLNFRPIVMLKSDILVISGSGTEEEPYVVTESAEQYYTITYCANEGYGTMIPQSEKQGSSITLNKNAYKVHGTRTFIGWGTTATGDVVYTDNQTIIPENDMTLYAVWSTCEHTWVSAYTFPNNCKVTTIYTCSGCGTTKTETTTSHTYNNNSWEIGDVTNCWKYCDCGEEYITDPHIWDEGTTQNNTIIYTCERCGGTKSEAITYTLTYNANGGSNAPESQTAMTVTVTSEEPTPPSGKAFRGWSTSSDAIVADYKPGASITLSKNTTLYAVYVTPLESGDLITESDVGAYVTYEPSSTSFVLTTDWTGYTNDQEYDPSSYTNWRVFSNDGTNVEIISDESIGDLYFSGEDGYTYAVWALNFELAFDYINDTYAESARSLGHSYEEIEDEPRYDQFYEPLEYGASGFPYEDEQYEYDLAVINNNGSLKQNVGNAWFASRYVNTDTDASTTHFSVRAMDNTGEVDNYSLYSITSDDIDSSDTHGLGVRPIITLKSELMVEEGDGSPSNPYVLAEPQYTLTYNANGGSGAPSTQTGTKLTISSKKPTRSGYTFAGWGSSSTSTSASWQPGGSITLSSNKTIYAVWEEIVEYTVTYDANGGYGEPDPQTGEEYEDITLSLDEPTPPEGYAFRGWSRDENAIVAEYKVGAELTLTEDIILYAVYVIPLESGDLFTGSDVGAYVTYEPSETSYTVSGTESGSSDQTYDPSSITEWRVFSNDGDNVEIIPDDIIGYLRLTGSTGYINLVQILQDLAAAYINDEYAVSARSLGYSEYGLTEDEITNYKVIDTDSYPIKYLETRYFPYIDSQYSEDYEILNNNRSLREYETGIFGEWLASRHLQWISASASISGRDSMSLGIYWFRASDVNDCVQGMASVYTDDTVSDASNSKGVRPIVTLNSDLIVVDGDGSPSNPYILEY